MTLAALALISACAPEPEPSATTPPSPSPSAPAPYDGPLTFVGDELSSFALTADEIAAVFPGAPPTGAVTDRLLQFSDGGGPEFTPAVCSWLIAEPSLWSVGARVVPWEGAEEGTSTGAQQMLQYPSEAHADAMMTRLQSTVEQCAQFDADGPGTFAAVIAPEAEGVRAFAGSLSADFAGNPWTAHHVFASVGNVLVHLWQPSPEEAGFDAEAAALLVRDRAVDARQSLIERLTGEPPQEEAAPDVGDPGTPWSEWAITSAAVGPLRLGESRDVVLAAVPGATVEDIGHGGHVRLRSADGGASLVLSFTEQGRLESVTAGIANIMGDEQPNGSALPSVEGVRIGAPLIDAVAALPEGTYVEVSSSGEYFYRWATRDGRVIDVRADRDSDDPDALISGVTVTDATLAPIPEG
ncbi:hypothetical protein [Microbacterium hydrocarbonoxydans]|uniref:hypothetical protein n=1 Tax=Microbacterium hydrocarbonoxydans TaxID=273678 RepID=UPI00203F84A1|nr:hypothetical protein [Microbacterium hydrocarbonoxydans]MCM3779509.1 hypothetical protein [Microbacterium hydrocarbonoxydans]